MLLLAAPAFALDWTEVAPGLRLAETVRPGPTRVSSSRDGATGVTASPASVHAPVASTTRSVSTRERAHTPPWEASTVTEAIATSPPAKLRLEVAGGA